MDLLMLIKAAILGIVEGLTEFLPISSTGHLIIAGSLLNFHGPVAKIFDVAIQTGAMLAVLWEYRRRFQDTISGIASGPIAQRFAVNVMIAFLPAVLFGLLLGKTIKEHLFYPVPVSIALVVGGLIILWIERRHKRLYGLMDLAGNRKARIETVDNMRPADALALGLIQCLALIPGTSRSGATIMGALVMGFSRKAATEFSFFLGVPTLIGAGIYSVYKDFDLLKWQDTPLFLVGTLFSAISAWLCIRWLIRYVSTHDFTVFAWYRIVFGLLILASAHWGWIKWTTY